MCQKSHEEQSRFEKERITQAKLIMKPFILRRVKNEVSWYGKVTNLYCEDVMSVKSVFCREIGQKWFSQSPSLAFLTLSVFCSNNLQ